MSMHVQVRRPAPILNTSDFSFAFGGKSGSEIPLDEKDIPIALNSWRCREPL